MAEIFVLLSKYLFVAYMAVFLISGFCINLEREGAEINAVFFIFLQRLMILAFHISGFVILQNQVKDSLLLGFGVLLLFMIAIALSDRLYKNASPVLNNGVFFLLDIGIVMLLRLNPELAYKQFIWCIIGVFALFLLPGFLNLLPRLDNFKMFYGIFAVVLLVSTLVFGRSLYGSTNWISIGPIAFQPSEVVKLLFVLFLASALAQKPTLRELIVPAVVSAIIILCLVAQKDLGSALIFAMTFLVVVYIATSNIFILILGLLVGGLAAFLGYAVFPHVQTRVNAWLDPWADIEHGSYQIAQSLFAIGSYGFWGSGLTRGYASYIPVVERDFIFSAVCEELGVLFGIGMILCFVMIFLEGVRASLYSRSRFLTLLSAGLTSLLTFQVFLIIGGDIKLVPLTGVTLPFVSYGGTSIVISFILVSIIQWIYMRNNTYNHDKTPEEYSLSKGRGSGTNTIGTQISGQIKQRPVSASRQGSTLRPKPKSEPKPDPGLRLKSGSDSRQRSGKGSGRSSDSRQRSGTGSGRSSDSRQRSETASGSRQRPVNNGNSPRPTDNGNTPRRRRRRD